MKPAPLPKKVSSYGLQIMAPAGYIYVYKHVYKMALGELSTVWYYDVKMPWYNLELLPVADVMTLFHITNVSNQGTEQPRISRQKKRAFMS